jgi:hypothetical protein
MKDTRLEQMMLRWHIKVPTKHHQILLKILRENVSTNYVNNIIQKFIGNRIRIGVVGDANSLDSE